MRAIKTTLVISSLLCVLVSAASAAEIKHRFLLSDESRHLLHYIDETDPSKSWNLSLGGGIHDIQLIGNRQVLASQDQGFAIYDMDSRKLVSEVKLPALKGTMSVRRRADGTTVVGANQKGITVFELDKSNAITRQMSFADVKMLRMMRLTADGNVILAEEQGVTEVAFDSASPTGGKIVKRIKLPRGRNGFLGLKNQAGNYLVGGGFGHAFWEISPDGKVIRDFEATDMPKPLVNQFYAGFQVLKSGNVVVCNWTGHSPPDSERGWQLAEFSPEGKLLWHWHDPKTAGTAINVIILDDLDPAVLNDDCNGTLGSGK